MVRKVLREILVRLVMDRGVHKVSLALLVCQALLDQEATLAPREILGPMAGQDIKVTGGSRAGLGPEVYQVVLDLQDPEVNREREALTVAQVTLDTQDSLVIKVYGGHRDFQDHQGL